MKNTKSKTISVLLALFLGGLGAHKFYLGKTVAGIFYLLFSFTFIPAFLGVLDALLLGFMSDSEFDLTYNR
ncbi:MAG: NINE protein [Patescibacteria group bacterium]